MGSELGALLLQRSPGQRGLLWSAFPGDRTHCDTGPFYSGVAYLSHLPSPATFCPPITAKISWLNGILLSSL